MRNMRYLNLLAGAGLLVNVACAGDDSTRPTYPSWSNSVLAEADTHAPNFANLVRMGSSPLRELLEGDQGVFTVFGPTSVGEVGPSTEGLEGVLKYHIVGTKLTTGNLRPGARFMTLAGATIGIGGTAEALTVTDLTCNTVNLTNPAGGDEFSPYSDGVDARNGILQVISGLLQPPAMTTSDYLGTGNVLLQDVTATLDQLGSFGALLDTAAGAGLATTLASSGERTLFAPNDAAFNAVSLSGVDAAVIENILLYHVSAGITTSCALGDSIPTLANIPAPIAGVGSATVTVGGALVGARVDIEGNNGVVHELDGVMVPPTIVELAAATADLSTLVEVVTSSPAADVLAAIDPDTLGGDSPVTVFAPTNDAFAAAGTIAPGDLVRILQHHAVAGQVLSSAFSGLEAGDEAVTVTTLSGDDLTFEAREETVDGEMTTVIYLIDGSGAEHDVSALFGSTNLRTLTGAVHVINSVLLPE